jgi:glycosyltransferase involved in cell wall biosynthesis
LFGKSSIVARALDFGLFYACVAFRVLFLPRQDASVWLTTPPFIALIGWLLRMVRGTPFVYWVMDLYPDLPIACGILRPRGIAASLLEALNRFCLCSADHVVVLGRCMKATIAAKGIPGSNISCINVWSASETASYRAAPAAHFRQAWHVGDRFLAMYSGNFGIGHDVATIASGVAELAGETGIAFAFVGGGKRKAELLRAVSPSDNPQVIDAPYQPRESLGDLLAAADVHLISMTDAVKGMLVPSKLYGVLAAGKPAVFVGPGDSEVGLVIRESDCGMIVPNGDGPGLAEAIRAYASDRARASRDGAFGILDFYLRCI